MSIKIKGNAYIEINGKKIYPNNDGEITPEMLENHNTPECNIKPNGDLDEISGIRTLPDSSVPDSSVPYFFEGLVSLFKKYFTKY
jgi:hypothetical protein